MELVRKPRAKSSAWNYFGFIPGPGSSKPANSDDAICRLCKRSVAAKGGNTSNLFSHLKKQHPRESAEVKAVSTSERETSESQQNSHCQPQQTIAKLMKYSRSSRRWQQLTDAVTNFLAKDMIPIYTVEKPGFRKLLAAFDSRYDLPSRNYFSRTAIPTFFAKVRETVKREVREADFYSSTTDMWSSRGLFPYMSYTVHFIDRSWQFQSRCLETCFLPEDHTGENIADALRDTLASWKLAENKQVCITTDNGSNVICATDKLEWQRLPCFGHCLNLAVTNTLKGDVLRAEVLVRELRYHDFGIATTLTSSTSMQLSLTVHNVLFITSLNNA